MRFYYLCAACVLVIVGGFWFDVRKQLVTFYDLNQRKKTLASEVIQDQLLTSTKETIESEYSQLKKSLNAYFLTDNKSALTASLIAKLNQAAEANGVHLQDIHPLVWKSERYFNTIIVQFKAAGDFNGFVQLLLMLGRFPMPLLLNDFKLHVDKKNNLMMEISLMGHYFPLEKSQPLRSGSLPSKNKNLFSARRETIQVINNVTQDYTELLQSVSFKQIKWVGYLRYGGQLWVLGKLPSGKTIEFRNGDRIGVEKAKLIKADEEKIIFLHAGHEVQFRYVL